MWQGIKEFILMLVAALTATTFIKNNEAQNALKDISNWDGVERRSMQRLERDRMRKLAGKQ